MGSINSQVVVLETSHSGLGALEGGRLSPELAMLLGQEGQSGINKADGLMRYKVEGEKGTPRALISVTWISKRQRLTYHMHFAEPLKATRMDCQKHLHSRMKESTGLQSQTRLSN